MENYKSKFEKAVELYKNGMSLTKIEKEVGIERHKLSREFKKIGLSIVKNNQKYNYNKDIFKQIDNEEKAYWLGFLYADGYVKKDRGIELTLQQDDYEHLVKFRKFIGDESVLISYKSDVNAYRMHINSREIAQNLINLGCVQAKSYILQFPTEEQVPRHLIHHFMRGYFDGDGCICLSGKQVSFSVIGTPLFLDNYESYLLNALNRTKANKRCKRNDWSENTEYLRYCGEAQTNKIFQFLYKDATIYLDRKYNKFNMLLPSQDEADK